MKKAVICGAATVALVVVLKQFLPDIRRYLRMTKM
ncbi:DUF6893 family small protein [Streptomyces sp. NBC_00162]